MVHTGRAEFASNLKAELLAVAFDFQKRSITEEQAKRRLAMIRRRRELGAREIERMMQPREQRRGGLHAAV